MTPPSLAQRLAGRRVGVVLSSAFFGFYAHAGFVRALTATGLRPSAYAGSSAGALVAAFAAAGDMASFIPELVDLRRKHFWDPGIPIFRRWGLLKGERFAQLLHAHLPVPCFEDCHTPLVTVSTNLDQATRRVDVTGPLAPAIASSCALPFLFRPVVRQGERYADGGLLEKAPIGPLLEHHDVEAVVIHLIPSRGLNDPAPQAPRKFLQWALDLGRDHGWRTQVELARSRGIETYVVETQAFSVGPFSMKKGAAIVEASTAHATTALHAPAAGFA